MYSVLYGKVSIYILYTDEVQGLGSTDQEPLDRAQLGTFAIQLGTVRIIAVYIYIFNMCWICVRITE